MLPGHMATSSNKRTRLNNYEFLENIGEGAFGKVKLARHLPTGAEVAVKVIPKDQQSSSSMKRLHREVQSLKTLNHPNIVKLFEVIDTEDTLFLVMEYVRGGDMSDNIEYQGYMREDDARRILRQLVSALHYCHQKGIVHRDLKPENILLDEELNVKLTDFGISDMFLGRKLRTYCGSFYYTAPEILLHQPYDGPPVDVWSLGVVLYLMLTEDLPFPGDGRLTWQQQVVRGRFRLPVYLSMECRSLLKKMMTCNPRKRITLKGIMQDPWVNMGQEKLRPYKEPPSDNRDPWVTEVMMTYLGLEWDKIQHSLRKKKYDDLMATYLIFDSKKPKEDQYTINETSIPSIDPTSRRSLPAFEVQPAVSTAAIGGNYSQPLLPTWFRKGYQQPENQKSEVKVKEAASPLPSPEPRTDTPSSTPPHGPGPSPSTPGTSKCKGAPGRTKCRGGGCGTGDSPDAAQPERVTPVSPSGPSQGRRGAAGRFLDFLSHFCLCLPSKKHGKHNRVKPQ